MTSTRRRCSFPQRFVLSTGKQPPDLAGPSPLAPGPSRAASPSVGGRGRGPLSDPRVDARCDDVNSGSRAATDMTDPLPCNTLSRNDVLLVRGGGTAPLTAPPSGNGDAACRAALRTAATHFAATALDSARSSSRRPLAKMTSNANGVGCSTHAPPRSSLPSARPCWLSRHTKMPFPRSKLNHRRVLNNADELEFLRALISQPSISGYNKDDTRMIQFIQKSGP